MKKSPAIRIALPFTGLALLALAFSSTLPPLAANLPLQTQLEGIVSVVIEDYFTPDRNGEMTGYAVTRYTVRAGEFEFVDLEGDADVLAKLQSGEQVVLAGQRESATEFTVTEIISRKPGPDMTAEKAFLGMQNLAVVPVRFPNRDLPSVCQWAAIDSIAFTSPQSLTKYWEETSFGKLTFSNQSKTFDVVTLPDNYVSGCDLNLWTAQANAIIGTEIDAFNRRVYVFPSSLTECPFGLGVVGNEGMGVTTSWIRGCNSPDAYIHELGHNFSLLHAWTTTQEYGDIGDVMGFGGVGVRKLNGPHVDFLDWLPDGEPHFRTLSGIGTYDDTLTALGRDYMTEPNATQVLKIFAPSLGKNLYVSYRDNHGMDANLRPEYQFKTHVHTQRNGKETTLLRVLSSNQAYLVGPDGITISQIGTDPANGTAQVRVVIETPNDCDEDLPIVTIAGQFPSHAAPGGTIHYTLDITNQDGITCLPADFRISASLPGDTWTSNQPVEITAMPGETVAPTLSVTSPTGITGFNYNFSIITTVPADVQNEHTVIVPATYRIDRLPPTIPSGLLMTGAEPDSVSMVWTPSTDSQSGVGHYEILRSFGDQDFSVIGQSPTPDYVDETAADGDLLWYLLRAFDNAGNASN